MRFSVSLFELSKAFWNSVPQEDLGLRNKPRDINPQNASYLIGLCQKLEVRTVVEIGTGVSTVLMSQVVEQIWTGDRDEVNLKAENVTQFRGDSTDFLKSLKEQPDLFFIDARLHARDFNLVKDLSREDTVYVLDDFEGIEKGVANAFGLQEGRLLMTPVDGRLGKSTLAALIPKGLIRLVNQ